MSKVEKGIHPMHFLPMRFLLPVFLVLLWPSVSFADQNCDAVLAANTVLDNGSRNISLATLDLINKDNFSEFSDKFSAGATLPIDGIPIDLNAGFNQFDQQRNSYKEEHKFDYSLQEVRNLSVKYISDHAIEAWSKCIGDSNNQYLVFRASVISATDIVLKAKWYPGATPEAAKVEETPIAIGGKVVGQFPKMFPPGRWVPIHFSRERGKPFTLDIQLSNGNADSVALPSYSPLIEMPPACTRADTSGCTACLVPISRVSLSSGGSEPNECIKMVPSANFQADFLINYNVVGATSKRTNVGITVAPGSTIQDWHEDFVSSGPSMRTIPGISAPEKSNADGDLRAVVSIASCIWVDDTGTYIDNHCTVQIERGSYLRFTKQ